MAVNLRASIETALKAVEIAKDVPKEGSEKFEESWVVLETRLKEVASILDMVVCDLLRKTWMTLR